VAERLREDGFADASHALEGGEGDVAAGRVLEEGVAEGAEDIGAVDEVVGEGRGELL
jgi:hypothetical protein